jgi:hypothetical protein
MTFRNLTPYEKRVFRFMARRAYTQGHIVALLRVTTPEEYEDVVQRAVDRYADWATD